MAKIYFTREISTELYYLEVLDTKDDLTATLNGTLTKQFIEVEVTTDVFQTISKMNIIRITD